MKYALTLIALILTPSLFGQEQLTLASRTKGFSAGIHAAYISHENDSYHYEAEYGFGYGFIAQYGFNHKMALALAYQHYSVDSKASNSNVNPYQLFEYDIIGKYTFGSSTSKLRPNLNAGFSFTNTEEGFYYEQFPINNPVYFNVFTTEEYYGILFLAGAGLSYYVTPEISLNASFLMHVGQFTKVYLTTNYTDTEKIDIESDIFNLNGQLGVQYHFK
ncbi:MAG TPA: outer membrane beta-barrel protein [Saprospiraceae bacterium]|nr:outer membrane beta-barrel protein [Saprospiraceae bacterium]